MMAHSRKIQGQYRKIMKNDNPASSSSSSSSVPFSSVSSCSSTVPSSSSSVPSSTVLSSNIPSSVSSSVYSLVSSSASIVFMPDDQFIKFMNKLYGSIYESMYKHM